MLFGSSSAYAVGQFSHLIGTDMDGMRLLTIVSLAPISRAASTRVPEARQAADAGPAL
jgi:hypothetical protein